MKTTRKILAAIVASAIILSGTVSTYAMNGNGNGHGMGRGQDSKEMMNTQISSSYTGTLTDKEKQELSYGYSEEMLAHDLYTYFYSLYNTQVFSKIASSEAEHMQAVKTLLDKYNLATPTDYGVLQSTFDTLKAEGTQSLQSALEVGLKVEMLDIDDISKVIAGTTNPDLQRVFLNIGGASYNHIRGFSKALNSNNLTTSIDFSSYLSQDELNTKGSLKSKLSEKLKSEGVNLVSYSGSTGKYDNLKKQIGNKYGKALEKMSDDKLQNLSDNIDKKISNVENSSMLDRVKQKTVDIYKALKEYINELFN